MLVELPEFFHPVNEAFAKHWLSLRGDELLPHVKDFRPEDVPQLLSSFVIYDLESRDMIRIRLAGSAILARHGFNSTGTNYLDLVAPERRAKASEAFWLLATQPCAMRVILRHEYENGLFAQTEALGMPMGVPDGETPRLYYTGQEIENEWRLRVDETGRTRRLGVLRRDFIDIGAGVPDFQD
ncbi:MAG: PAS domain-containing protein [Alphaproteobacteria bacterium]